MNIVLILPGFNYIGVACKGIKNNAFLLSFIVKIDRLTHQSTQTAKGLFRPRVWVALLVWGGCWLGVPAEAGPGYRLLGQPTLADTSLASRCPLANAQFNFLNNGGFEMYGPSGIAVDPRGRLYVTDFGGQRVLTWPNFAALQRCQAADGVIGAGVLAGPESVAIDPRTETIFVADTLSHTVRSYRRTGTTWNPVVTLGTPGQSGNGLNQFNFPRGLAVDANGRLFVADDFNNRVLIFNAPFSNGEFAADSIGGFANGGFRAEGAGHGGADVVCGGLQQESGATVHRAVQDPQPGLCSYSNFYRSD